PEAGEGWLLHQVDPAPAFERARGVAALAVHEHRAVVGRSQQHGQWSGGRALALGARGDIEPVGRRLDPDPPMAVGAAAPRLGLAVVLVAGRLERAFARGEDDEGAMVGARIEALLGDV